MKKVITLLFAFTAYTVSVFAQPGTPDPSYGTNGFSLFQPGFGIMPHDSGKDIVAAPDGTSFICGAAKINGYYQGILLHVLSNGVLDNAFGTSGKIFLDYGNNSGTYAENIDLLPDGKLIVSGTTYLPSGDAEFFVARFLADGTPDITFGSGGFFITALSNVSEENNYAQVIQPDGKIVLAGNTGILPNYNSVLVRVNSNGTLDNTFGTGGYNMITNWSNHDRFNAVSLLPSGEIIAAGITENAAFEDRAFIAKFNSSGNLVTTFGNSGVLIPTVLDQNSGCYGLAVYNNYLFLTGWIGTQDIKNIFTSKLDLLGNPVNTFGNGGIAVTDVNTAPSDSESGLDIKIQPDGKTVVCGTTGNPGTSDRNLIVLRLTTAGIPDPSFGITSAGYTITSLGAEWDELNAMDFLPDGKIVATGMSPQNNDNAIVAACYLNNGFEPTASFVVDNDSVCTGSTVQFTSTSAGYFLQYNWSFPGGTPSTSTLQNPTVQYNSNGIFNVQLTVTNVLGSDAELINNFITVFNTVPIAPVVPTGPAVLCSGQSATYTIAPVPGAVSYLWSITPAAAGALTPNGTSAIFNSSSIFAGAYSISVIATGQCGNSPSSPALTGTITTPPQIYTLEGEGSYCSGTSGATLTLSGSQTGVNYEILLNNASTGSIMAGTGSTLTWNNIIQQGFYTVVANSTSCSLAMAGQIYVSMISVPAQPASPSGEVQVCNNATTIYNTTPANNADSYQWTLNPANAGTITSNGLQATIVWNNSFSGLAELTVSAINVCGTSIASSPLEIAVNDTPQPVITGLATVCQNWTADYETPANPGSTYLWTVTGGNIVSGAGTAAVRVKWTDSGAGTLSVAEASAQNCTTTSSVFNVLIDPCVGVEVQASNQNLIVFPNPVGDFLFVKFPENNGKTIHVFLVDPAGRIVVKQSCNNSMNNIEKVDVSQLKGGFYTVQFLVDGVSVSQAKIIKY